jgi:hypothetical protein
LSIADVVEMPTAWLKKRPSKVVRVHESANRTQIYHVGAKPFFKAIGEQDNRNRR